MIEKFDGVARRVNQHAVVEDVDDAGALGDLHPGQRDDVHYRHDLLSFVCVISLIAREL